MAEVDAGFRPVILGVAGGSGSGKSTVVREVRASLGETIASVLPHDAYYRELGHLTLDERAAVTVDHPDSLETELMAEHVRLLRDGSPVEVPVYDFATHMRTSQTRTLDPTAVIILDGILVLADQRLRDTMDLKVFGDTEPDIRLLRRIRRDVVKRGRTADSVIRQYEATVRPMHMQFVEPSKRFADLVVPEGGHNRVAVDLVVGRIRALLAERGPQTPA